MARGVDTCPRGRLVDSEYIAGIFPRPVAGSIKPSIPLEFVKLPSSTGSTEIRTSSNITKLSTVEHSVRGERLTSLRGAWVPIPKLL